MTQDELEGQLRYWGRVFGIGPPCDDDEDRLGASNHPLVSGAPSTRYERPSRRRAPKFRYYTDVNGKRVRELAPPIISYGSQSKGGPKPIHVPPAAEDIEVAVNELYRTDRLKALVVRQHYCNWYVERHVRVANINEMLGMRINNRRYRRELSEAHMWLHGRLAARTISAA